MRIRPKKQKGTISIMISSSVDSEKIPKLVELLNVNMTVLQKEWTTESQYSFGGFNPGIFLVRLTLPSGIIKQDTVELHWSENLQILFDLESISPEQEMEWVYVSKRRTFDALRSDDSGQAGYPILLSIELLRKINGIWETDARMQNRFINPVAINNRNGIVIELKSRQYYSLMKLGYPGLPPKFVCLPPNNGLKILITPFANPDLQRHPIEVLVSTDQWEAEALLSILKTGATKDGEKLISLDKAEQMLFDKRRNEAVAAIGGYFLLNLSAYRKMRDWSRNLAEWFPHLPDGSIIYASQLINKKSPGVEIINESRAYFLKAVNIGLPVYTQGFRLLIDGLTLISYHFNQEDREVEAALKAVKYYQRMIDWNRDTTTINTIKANIAGEPTPDIFQMTPGSWSLTELEDNNSEIYADSLNENLYANY